MNIYHAGSHDDLRDIIDQKIASLVQEMEDAGWSAADTSLAINDVVKTKWLDQLEALQEAREAVSASFVSDGNEG
jgi:hypothetical protein